MIFLKNRLAAAATKALLGCMKVTPKDTVLIVYDAAKSSMAFSLYAAAQKHAAVAALAQIPEGKQHGEEPPAPAARMMKLFSVVLAVTSKSISHTKARREACAAGARIASLPGITEDMFIRGMSADYPLIERRTAALSKVMAAGKRVHITTDLGTDLHLDITGKKPHGGVLPTRKGEFHNLPSGEVDLGPVEGTSSGVFVVDASMMEKIDAPITILVENGKAVSITGGRTAKKVSAALAAVKDPRAYTLAELGIGTNDKAKIIGNILEDEKVLGTCHIALGNNLSYGGTSDVPIHLDGIIRKPTITVDGKKIMEKGRLLVKF